MNLIEPTLQNKSGAFAHSATSGRSIGAILVDTGRLSPENAERILRVQGLAGEVQLELLTLDGGHFIHSSEFPLFFNLSALDYDRLTGIDAGLVSGESNPP